MNRENCEKMADIEKMDAHDREVMGAVIGLAKTCGNNPYTDETVRLMADTLIALNNACAKEDDRKVCDESGMEEASQLVEQLHKEKYTVSPGCAVCQARCGNTDDYDIALILDEEPEKIKIKEKLIYYAVQLAQAAHKDNKLYSDDGYRLVFIGMLTVLSYDMSVKGLENALEQAKRWEMD